VRQPRTALLKRAIEQRDDELIDLLASHLGAYQPRSGDMALIETARLAASYYAAAGLDEAAQAARTVRILKRVPAGTIRSLRQLERANPLASALFARVRAAARRDPRETAELLSAPDRQILSLALEALAGAGARAAPVIEANLDLLLDLLARPVDRPAARRVLKVLGCVESQPSARRILERVRGDLAAGAEPREALAQLAGSLLHRFPDLRLPSEQPAVYRRKAA
jgi:hypothetical protein